MKALTAASLLLVLLMPMPPAAAQSDLDAFMQRVMTRRDDSWKKLQQYILDEREVIELRGPDRAVMWGDRREFTWYMRDGRFVRSPLRFNGVEIGDADRRKYEADFVRREQEREKRRAENPSEFDGDPDEPQFVTSAYFLRFKFESGKYALVGREALEGRQVLRIEYYPTKLFEETRSRSDRPERNDEQRRRAEQTEPLQREVQRVLNKAALVTLWIDPETHQILKYTFDNVGSGLSALSITVNSLPLGWLAQVEELRASMTMGEAFPDVWLPRALDMRFAVAMAVGQFDVQYALDYHDYRRADVTSTIRIPQPH